ncbi:phosphonate metabolism protein/1,5-bisphosphokinase (PRPP-forming) PhnN [Aestuariispira insulae]|uniref:ribose 1,5-bisphosphate phosphokinase n=1 Tax=Aestuariispira insulae TaxID=1461337 RepID=A0A3D9HN72_9PROT|nr:phosphonate metabolism protein/1,5-bisphosphokinase (PRPP-forming) PhnN [Aestuariispira insulae]RED50957.1 ribose 1,5-bisphosphokinase [Aestuariispira insulae]
MTQQQEGTLVLVVGPSGSGKDSLIRAVRERLAGDSRFHFAKRVITRAEHDGIEDHIHTTMDGFQLSEEGNAFLLHWHAHGHAYGIPGHIRHVLEMGQHVIVNVSRGVIEQAMAQYGHVRVIAVQASLETAFKRLKERGRESEEEIAQRLKRYDFPIPAIANVFQVDNDGSFDDAVTCFTEFLFELA